MERQRILITGGVGMLGSAFAELFARGNYEVRAYSHLEFDVTHRKRVLEEASWNPEIIIHCAGIVNADYCEDHRNECFENHVGGTQNIVDLTKTSGAKLFYPQSFLIFDGVESPITEETLPHPLSVYGAAKLEAEQRIQKELSDALTVRMGGFFGGYEKDKNFVGKFARILKQKIDAEEATIAVGNRVWQPTYTKELAENSILLLTQEKTGIYHMASHGEASFYDVACAMIETLGLPLTAKKISAAEFTEKCRRPMRAVLDNKRLREEGLDRMSPWKDALTEYLSAPYFCNIFERS